MTLRPVPDPPEEPAGEATHDEILRWALAYLRHAPLSLSLREINRLVAYGTVAGGRGPVLDVGCGDGFWWTVREEHREIYGIDISASEIAQARQRINAELTDVSRETPFRGQRFEEVIGNCSLEHVPDIDAALSNLRRAASDRARLLMFVPTPRWAYQGLTQQFLLKRAPRIAMALSGAVNGFFQHWHLYDAKVWQRLLEQNGWRVEQTLGLGSARSEFLFRLFLPPAFIEFAFKQVTGFYPSRLARILPDSVIAPLAKLMRWAVSDPIVPADSPHAYEYLIVAHAT
jgi:SAM-dependent methyltransferase